MAELDSGIVDEMRDWGLVAPSELERIVVISPHLDDAVLGCGRLLAAHPGATVDHRLRRRARDLPGPDDALGHDLRLRPPATTCSPRRTDEDHARARRARRDAGVARLRRAPVPRPSRLGRRRPDRRRARGRDPGCGPDRGPHAVRAREPGPHRDPRRGAHRARPDPRARLVLLRGHGLPAHPWPAGLAGGAAVPGRASGRRPSRRPSTTATAAKRRALVALRLAAAGPRGRLADRREARRARRPSSSGASPRRRPGGKACRRPGYRPTLVLHTSCKPGGPNDGMQTCRARADRSPTSIGTVLRWTVAAA